ncbi:acyl-CoA carboxylase subunit epsilon [Streptomyces rectiverticillatus]|nr:acyl-CoA carboxylase subunit epsilon [Streptomyces rectiverticillatus]
MFLRIVRGEPDPGELAALTAVLFELLAAAPPEGGRGTRAVASWHRPERSGGFRGPRTWQDGTR